MPAGVFSGFPQLAQAVLYGILGLGITGAALISYVKGLRKERLTETGHDDSERDSRLIKSIDRLDDSLNRSTDAVRESTDTASRLYRHLASNAAMPPNEELLILLRQIHDRVRETG